MGLPCSRPARCSHCGVSHDRKTLLIIFKRNNVLVCRDCAGRCGECGTVDTLTDGWCARSLANTRCRECAKHYKKCCKCGSSVYPIVHSRVCSYCVACKKYPNCHGNGDQHMVETRDGFIHVGCIECAVCMDAGRVTSTSYHSQNWSNAACDKCVREYMSSYLKDPMTKLVPRDVMCILGTGTPMHRSYLSKEVCERQQQAVRALTSVRCGRCETDVCNYVAAASVGSEDMPPLKRIFDFDGRTVQDFIDAFPVTLSTLEMYLYYLDKTRYQVAWRGRLKHRMLLSAGIVNTKCCNTAYCYKCKVRVDGRHVCRDDVRGRNLQVRKCPRCSVLLARTEGCNSVRCPCGNNFRWSEAPLA